MNEIEKSSPKCFISYSWDSKPHEEWVRELATKLHESGVFTQLDQWDLKPGQDMMEFMEYSVRTSDFVFLICTPSFAEKANAGRGGVGYEKSIVTGEIFYSTDGNTKFIPLLVDGNPKEALPSFLKSKVFIDFRKERDYDQQFEELIRSIYDTPKFPKPQLGIKPNFSNQLDLKNNIPSSDEYLNFKFGNASYNLKLPDWWNNIDINVSRVSKKTRIEDYVRRKYGADVGTNETWKQALKTHALCNQKLNKIPIYVAHCASEGKDYELSIKVYSELYHLIDFLEEEKQNWYHTYLAYETGGDYEAIGQNELAISWYKKATVFLSSSELAINYYANESLKRIQYLSKSK